MPTTRRSRVLAAPLDEIWAVVEDPEHLPRWWPRLRRVEGVGGGRWTMVLTTSKGRQVRADYRLAEFSRPRRVLWAQELEDSPFERLLSEALTEIELEPAEGGTRVSIALRQRLRGWARFGGVLFRRAGRAQLDEALEGLARISGG